MKFFSSILALYMMVLFMTPCSDTFGEEMVKFEEYSTEVTHQQDYQSHDHDHQDTNDLCTPFCTCTCCGAVSGVVLQWNAFSFSKLISVNLSKPISYYKPIFIPHYFGEIWQPPKINA